MDKEETKIIQCSGNKSGGSRCTREKEIEIDFEGKWYC
jgi:hypothetical protein